MVTLAETTSQHKSRWFRSAGLCDLCASAIPVESEKSVDRIVSPVPISRAFKLLSGCRGVEDQFLLPDTPTVDELGNKRARCRWKIANEGFNIQKNGGFNIEHAYSTKRRQMHNWYILLQIAHLILQFLERGSLLCQDVKRSFGSIRAMAQRLWESIRNVLIPQEALDIAAAARIQIRFNSS